MLYVSHNNVVSHLRNVRNTCAACAVEFAFKNSEIEESCWLRFAPEYFRSLKLRLMDPLRAWVISAFLNDLTAPAARKSRFMVPAPGQGGTKEETPPLLVVLILHLKPFLPACSPRHNQEDT